jgi:hypothetical protein
MIRSRFCPRRIFTFLADPAFRITVTRMNSAIAGLKAAIFTISPTPAVFRVADMERVTADLEATAAMAGGAAENERFTL